MKLFFYAIHSACVALRRPNLQNLLTTLTESKLFDDVSMKVIDVGEVDTLTQDGIRAMTDFVQLPAEDPLAYFNPLISSLHMRHLSNLLKHAEAMRLIAEADDVKDAFHIVVEDDVVYGDRLAPLLLEVLGNLPRGFDVTFLGLPAPKGSEENNSGSHTCAFKAVYNVAPVCDSYVMSKKGAQAMVTAMRPLKFATNIQMSYAIHKLALSAHFSRPNLFIDGSKLGVFVSSIETNNSLVLNVEYHAAKDIVDREVDGKPYRPTAEEEARLREKFETMRFNKHPDVVFLLAKLERNLGNIARAKELFAVCFSSYRDNGCVLNNQSTFLKAYIHACSL